MEKCQNWHERARNSESGEKSKFLRIFAKNGENIFFAKKYACVQNICLVRIPLNFSTWMELGSDLNAGRWVVQGQLYDHVFSWGGRPPSRRYTHSPPIFEFRH